MPGKRRTNWTRLKQRSKAPRVSASLLDTEIEDAEIGGIGEIEESEVPFSELARAFNLDEKPANDEAKKRAETLSEQLMQLSQDFAVFSTAFEDIYFSAEPRAGVIQKAKLALGVVSATLDVVDTLHYSMD